MTRAGVSDRVDVFGLFVRVREVASRSYLASPGHDLSADCWRSAWDVVQHGLAVVLGRLCDPDFLLETEDEFCEQGITAIATEMRAHVLDRIVLASFAESHDRSHALRFCSQTVDMLALVSIIGPTARVVAKTLEVMGELESTRPTIVPSLT
jgi:hypothetical protein